MQARGFYALLALTLAVVLAAVALSFGGDGPRREASAGATVLSNVAARAADIATVAVRRDKGTLTLQRGEAGWTIAERSHYPADPGKVRQALVGLADLKLVEAKTRKPELYPRLEVEDVAEGAKSALVEVKDAGGQTIAQLIVGKRRIDRLGAGNDGIYVRRPGEAQAWLAQGSLDLTGEPKDWLDKKVVSIPPAEVTKVTISHPDGSTLVIARENGTGKFAVPAAPPDTKWKNDTAINEPAGALDNFELTDVTTLKQQPVPEDAVVAELVTEKGLVVKASTWTKDDQAWVRLEAAGEGADAINAKTGKWVYAVPAWKANPLKTKLADLVEAPKES
jgi:hypothetical protein